MSVPIGRRAILALPATLAMPHLATAQAAGRVIMASWGGRGAQTYRDVYGAPFTRETGIPVTVAEVSDPAAAVAAAQGRPQHNVIVAASYQAANLANRGLIQELTPDDIPNVRHIPEEYWVRDRQGKLIGMPTSFLYYGIAYNKELARASDLQSWHALKDRKWRGQLSITRPVFLGPYDLTLFAKLNGSDENDIRPGVPMLEAIARNAGAVYTSMASLQTQLSRGEVAAAPFYSSQVQLLRRAGERQVDIILPEEGGLNLSYVFAIPKNAPDQEAARRFLNRATDHQAAIGVFREAGSLPLNPEVVIPAELEQELGLTMAEVRRRNYAPNWYTIAANLDERVRLAEQIVDRAR
ncbi:ABC transporter substrate-binding protein [Roseomonas marmotae]|uniref:Extracellular solute-binding protein n=1 Tax=Roseomonas marmotae TaxID=2768161 RepID=A0ABS3KHZ2_9PROT|nr:extracellular solute-binding protein [Roseomonas marmotae]MBO1077052.1 extracellular solute-binding protein [Roseomonas marmotae]QTI82111.1 extracellular solute-binding protein [Roseomonas marmotae]